MATRTGTITAALAGSVALFAAAALLAGCDRPPPPPVTADGKPVTAVVVSPTDPDESAAVTDFLTAEGKYRIALQVLHEYYFKTGAYQKQLWAEREQENFAQARTWQYEGITHPADPPAQSISQATEPALAEQVVAARQGWLDALSRLEAHYAAAELNFKLALVRNVQRRFDPVRTYRYFLQAEIPPATLKPTTVIPAAEKLFAEAMELHRQGKPLPAITDYAKQRRALGMLLELVREYPTSRQIAVAAYTIADIYKEYFNENVRAVLWYERAWQWDPKIMKPARFQAAVVYDYRLAQYAKALDLYRQVVKYEPFNQSNVAFAQRRIAELTAPKQ